MSILIEKAGIFDTVQDLGRYGYQKFGVNPNGAMDQTALRLINLLLRNPENTGAIEFYFPAPVIKFECDATFALGGAYFDAQLDGNPIDNWHSYSAKTGSVLRFKRPLAGACCYFAVAGGFKIDNWLGSESTNLLAQVGGYYGRTLKKGDRIDLADASQKVPLAGIARSLQPGIHETPTVRIIQGPEFDQISDEGISAFLGPKFRIKRNSNRMGFRLEGNLIPLKEDAQILSSGASFGTVQVLANGKPVILMADHQTTGGYPRIGVVIRPDLAKLAQLDAGDEIRFELISLKLAEEILEDFERDLDFLRVGMQFREHNGKY